MKLIDLSHTIEDGLVTYKGLPAPIICDYLSREASRELYEEGAEFQIGKIEMIANTGTYLDCPFHRYADGEDLSEIRLEQFTNLPAVVINHDYEKDGLSISLELLKPLKKLKGMAVLFRTNWDRHWNAEQYYENNPFISIEVAEWLVLQGVKLVGIDSYNVDDTRKQSRPIHSILLGNNVLIVEHLTNLSKLPHKGFSFSAVPPKIKGMGTFPVRAFASIE